MPKDNNFYCYPLHTTPKFDKMPNHRFVEQLNAIDVQIVGAPSLEEFRRIISVFMMNTWNDRIKYEFDDYAIDKCIEELFAGNILPTGMETINITWSVSGLNMVDTTHLIRHRLFSFSAQTHADRDMREDNVLVPASIYHNDEYYERFRKLIMDASSLYCDLMDEGGAHCLDARLVMPRCFEHFYIVRSCIKDIIAFCQMRRDEQIQTAADNIVALKLWIEVVKRYPCLKNLIDFRAPDKFYIKQCEQGKTNIFPPNEKNDIFDWPEAQFFHEIPRDAFPSGNVYTELRDKLLNELDTI